MAVGRGAAPGSDIVRISLQIKIKFLQLDKRFVFFELWVIYITYTIPSVRIEWFFFREYPQTIFAPIYENISVIS